MINRIIKQMGIKTNREVEPKDESMSQLKRSDLEQKKACWRKGNIFNTILSKKIMRNISRWHCYMYDGQ